MAVAVIIATLDMRLYAVSLVCGVLGIFLAVVFILKITHRPILATHMQTVASDIRTSASAYLNRQIRTVLLVTPFFAALLYFILGWTLTRLAVSSLFGRSMSEISRSSAFMMSARAVRGVT